MLSWGFSFLLRWAFCHCVLTRLLNQPLCPLVSHAKLHTKYTTYLSTRKSFGFNHRQCPPTPLPHSSGPPPSGTGKPDYSHSNLTSISASPKPPRPGSRILWKPIESNNQQANTHAHTWSKTRTQVDLIDWWSDSHGSKGSYQPPMPLLSKVDQLYAPSRARERETHTESTERWWWQTLKKEMEEVLFYWYNVHDVACAHSLAAHNLMRWDFIFCFGNAFVLK